MKSKNSMNLTNCWKKIGIYGDGSCPKLKDHIHCKKCPVYSAAGKRLLDREIPDTYREEWAQLYSRRKEMERTDTIFVVVFRLGGEWFASKTAFIQEIIESRPVHSVPFRNSETFLGLININGELIPCLSLSHIVGLSMETEVESEQESLKPMMVINHVGERFVFSVDEIMGIQRISPDDMKIPPATVSKTEITHTESVFTLNGKTVGLLDDEKLIESLKRSMTF